MVLLPEVNVLGWNVVKLDQARVCAQTFDLVKLLAVLTSYHFLLF